ncbi:integrator complex subunit 13-like [Physella acuta]|uniref:integrator complex subunit 13-like n=1 Tax=Physella acuta TaxID=109671 RepID=UPI0027DC54B1|nr:integrator complex subunit 13-like [Physella acuta]XP_059143114.1 integrator complex subunit 13-like [Physella acuta]
MSTSIGMTFPVSHKTIFVLDHSSYFTQSCNQPIEYDVLKSKGSGVIPAAPITKSLWTCNVEGLQEYLRIVFDIYPKDKLVRVIRGGLALNPWNCPDTINTINLQLARVGPPRAKKDDSEYSVHHGLTCAVKCLCEPSLQQQECINRGDTVRNRGRIICLTNCKTDLSVRQLEEFVLESIQQHNKMTGELLPIDACELVVLHAVPLGQDIRVTDKRRRELSPILASEVTTTLSGRHVYNKLVLLCCQHFDLCSTTVTGIPMKEEQNASSSANYDVELLHPAAAHDEMFKNEHAEGLVIPSKEGLPIETAPLKWCTPKSSVVELHMCSAVYRTCPVDVNSRPSSCLTNFLLSGRAVMLEQPRKSGVKVISHMLAAHGGEIYIHSIPTSRSILEDPPSISEGCGGRVTDYRITVFGEFMKENRLAPTSPALMEKYGGRKPYLYALDQLEKSSRFWPMVISDTILFNLQNISPLPQLLLKDKLTEPEVLECKMVIYKIVNMESKNDPLPVPAAGSRGKGPKREEQYRQLWAELEALISAYSDTSIEHGQVLECLMECKKQGDDSTSHSKKLAVKKEEKTEAEQSWKDFDRLQQMTERERQDALHKENKSVEPSPPKKKKTEELSMRSGGQTLLSMWNNRLRTIESKRSQDFDGRLDSDGDKARLYIHLDEMNG